MNHSPADIIRWLLIDLGEGTDPDDGLGWPVYCASEPNTPDNCITVYDTAGTGQGRVMNDGEALLLYGFQVRVRSINHSIGWIKAFGIRTALSAVYQQAVVAGVDVYQVHSIDNIGDVLALGVETPTSKRRLFTLNASLVL